MRKARNMVARQWLSIQIFLTLFLSLLFSVHVSAQHGKEEPFGAWPLEEEIEHLGITLAYPLQKSEKEINVVTTFQRFNSTDRMSKDLAMRVEFDYGLSHRMLLGLEYSYVHLNPDGQPSTSGSGDIEVEGKYMYLSNQWLAASLGMAVGSKFQEEGDREPFVELFFPLSHEFSDRVRSHLNLGIEWIGKRKPERVLQTALELRPLTSALILQTGLNFEFEENETLETSLVGGFLLPIYGLKLGLGFPIGLTENAQNWGISFNLEFEFEDEE